MRCVAMRHSPMAYGMLLRTPRDGELTADWVTPACHGPADPQRHRPLRPWGRPRQPCGRRAGTRRFDGPVRIVWGTADRCFTLKMAKRLTAAFADAALIEVADVSTFVSIDAPKAVADSDRLRRHCRSEIFLTFESSRIVCTLSAGSMKGRVDDASEFTAALLRADRTAAGVDSGRTTTAARKRPCRSSRAAWLITPYRVVLGPIRGRVITQREPRAQKVNFSFTFTPYEKLRSRSTTCFASPVRGHKTHGQDHLMSCFP